LITMSAVHLSPVSAVCLTVVAACRLLVRNFKFSVFDIMIDLMQLSTANLRADLQNYKNSLAEKKPISSLIRVGL